MTEWVEVTDPNDLVEMGLPQATLAVEQIEPEPIDLTLPTKEKRCVVCQNYLLVRPTEFSDATVSFVYHQSAVLGAPCAKHFGWPQAQGLGPHLCKTCIACGYSWPEALPAPPEDEET